MNWIEITATIAGALCVWLLVRQSIWNFPLGILQVTLSIYVFWVTRLYSDLILHVIYIILNVYGWIHWARGGDRESQLPVTRLTRREIAGWLFLTIVLTAAWGTFAKVKLNAAAPYADAAILMASLVAQWLTARKKLESWWMWILVDLIAVPVYLSRELYYFAALYVAFMILCIAGLKEWRQSIDARSPAPAPAVA